MRTHARRATSARTAQTAVSWSHPRKSWLPRGRWKFTRTRTTPRNPMRIAMKARTRRSDIRPAYVGRYILISGRFSGPSTLFEAGEGEYATGIAAKVRRTAHHAQRPEGFSEARSLGGVDADDVRGGGGGGARGADGPDHRADDRLPLGRAIGRADARADFAGVRAGVPERIGNDVAAIVDDERGPAELGEETAVEPSSVCAEVGLVEVRDRRQIIRTHEADASDTPSLGGPVEAEVLELPPEAETLVERDDVQ